MSFVLVDAWLLFFSKNVNFMADLYGCISAVALVETTFIWVSSLFIFRFLVAQGNVVPLGITGNEQNIRNPPKIPLVNTT